MNNQILAMAVAGAAVGYLTGAMNIRDDLTSAILGGVIGMGIGYMYSSLGQSVAVSTTYQPAALTSGYTL